MSAGVLAVPGAFPAQQTGRLGQCGPEQNLPCRACMQPGEEVPGVPSGCSLQREPVALPCELLSTLRTPQQRVWWVGELPKQCEEAGPSGRQWGSSSSFLFEKLTVITVEMSGWNLEEVVLFFSPHIYIYIYKMYPSTTRGNLIYPGWQNPACLFFPGKERILIGN